jgi:hypothetical protein
MTPEYSEKQCLTQPSATVSRDMVFHGDSCRLNGQAIFFGCLVKVVELRFGRNSDPFVQLGHRLAVFLCCIAVREEKRSFVAASARHYRGLNFNNSPSIVEGQMFTAAV